MSGLLQFPVRRYRAHPLPGEPYDEPNFGYVQHELTWEPAQTAVITIDLWNMAWLPEPLDPALGRYAEYNYMGVGESLMAVMHEIESERIAPALAAARTAGLTVIHTNTGQIALKHPQNAIIDEHTPSDLPSWPPEEVSREWIDDYYRHTWGAGCWDGLARIGELADFPPPLMPGPDDIVVCQQSVLDRLLQERAICNLIYMGFMLNMCLMESTGGVMRMVAPHRNPGYRGVVLRDCTCASESHETIADLGVTRVWLYQLETTGTPTALSVDFVRACDALCSAAPDGGKHEG